eukprot:CAMPEP_0172556770 /NCGR_PEP_ID=MMETSP1067-20121228/68894_1 /TAXON_ID=265564 ORGANISM="Thalassiosira punctigera, Strain Tpunct2005C2" /NCGR_SAMPLE_ID=MMETSP1067 /ASSEMBLY_ACC=CAM_ASM_000444 /LENGTH=701 /DNA_ID=CAMNT_0013345665 /DNA_START=164 /DNA_END=2269 /DNA_ORIENTATION=+
MSNMSANDDRRRNQNSSGVNSSSSTPPIALPGTNYGNSRHNFSYQDTALLPSSVSLSIPHKLFLEPCLGQSSSPWGTDSFLGCSPMVSGPHRNLRLPDLDLREARRAAAAAANARVMAASSSADFAAKKAESRRRSQSIGSERDRKLGESNHSSSLLLGEEILKRKTPSGLSLMDLAGDFDIANHIENSDNHGKGYGSSAKACTKTLIKAEETKSLRASQSCSIADLNPSSPAPPAKSEKVDREMTIVQELKEEFESQSNPPMLSLLYGIVNCFIVLPVIMSFGSIIYHDDFFRPYMSVLMKLTVVSGVVHQITFSTFSSLPFAVGQVQDAGLIFLSAMATDVVLRLKSMSVDDTSILATVTIGLSIYTALLGCALCAIGKFQLASYCQLLPSSVVGGYLAYIGFFCGQAGLALMASVDVTGLSQWHKFLDRDALILLTPGVIGGCAIYFSVRTLRHMAVLPSSIIMLMVAFYAILWATGTSVQEATENGWINKSVESPSWYHTWDFLKIDKVVWSVLPSQTLTALAMISVVALSSSLDIAAIEIELKRPLDYNHELQNVGLSNIISGLTGGYTGSYIFSQTIFSLRMGIRSRLMGYVIAFVSLVAVVIPVNILSYIPNYFFGSLLIMICLDLMFEWLIDVRTQVTSAEYLIMISTFALLLIFGVEFGIISGIVFYIIIQRMGYDVGNNGKLNEDGIIANC